MKSKIQLVSLSLRNCGKHKSLSINFGPSNSIFGPNWAGKSTVMESILVGLFGHSATQLTKFINKDAKDYQIVLKLTGDLTITRSKSSATVEEAGVAVAVGQTDVNKWLTDKFGLDLNTFEMVNMLTFDSIGQFASTTNSAFASLVEKFIGVDTAEVLTDALNKRIYQMQMKVAAVPTEVEVLDHRPMPITTETQAALKLEIEARDLVLDNCGVEMQALTSRTESLQGEIRQLNNEVSSLSHAHSQAVANEQQELVLAETIRGLEQQLAGLVVEDTTELAMSLASDEHLATTIKALLDNLVNEVGAASRGKAAYDKTSSDITLLAKNFKREPNVSKGQCEEWLRWHTEYEAGESNRNRLKAVKAQRAVLENDNVALLEIAKKLEVEAAGFASLTDAERNELLGRLHQLQTTLSQPENCAACGQKLPHEHDPAKAWEEVDTIKTRLELDRAHVKTRDRLLEVGNRVASNMARLTILSESEDNLSTVNYRDISSLPSKPELEAMLQVWIWNWKIDTKLNMLKDSLDPTFKDVDVEGLNNQIAAQKAELDTLQSRILSAKVKVKLEADKQAKRVAVSKQVEKLTADLFLMQLNSEPPSLLAGKLDAVKAKLQTTIEAKNLAVTATHGWAMEHQQVTNARKELVRALGIVDRALASFAAVQHDLHTSRELLTVVKTVKDRALEQGYAVIADEATKFACMVTGGKIESVQALGGITYVEDGHVLPIARASGGQKSILALAVKYGLASISPASLDLLLMDEALGTLRDDVAESVMDAVHNLGVQTVSISHRLELAENVITLS